MPYIVYITKLMFTIRENKFLILIFYIIYYYIKDKKKKYKKNNLQICKLFYERQNIIFLLQFAVCIKNKIIIKTNIKKYEFKQNTNTTEVA